MSARVMATIGIGVALLSSGACASMPEDMTVDRLLTICGSSSVGAALAQGDTVGWRRSTDAELQEWKTNFEAYNGGSVEIVGWRREGADRAESLSFWIAVGPNAHKACAYSTDRPDGLLEALSERLGAPDTLENRDAMQMDVAYWSRGTVEYNFVRIGSVATVNIGPGR